MTLDLRNIWDVINKRLALINAIIWRAITWNINGGKRLTEKNIPLALNILLLFVLLFLVFTFTYGAYRRQVG